MSVVTVSELWGQYQISKGVTEADLEHLAANPNTKSIQLVSPLSVHEVDQLEKLVFSLRPDIALRVYGHYGETCDLTFLRRIPSLRRVSADCLRDAKGIEEVAHLEHLEHLGVGIYNLDSFDFLNEVNANLKELYLELTKSKKPKITGIRRFGQLEYLYLEGQQKGIEAINDLKNLQRIVLRSISTENVDYLKNLQHLWSVDVKLGGIKDFSALASLTALKYLELWQVRGLADLSFMSQLESLQFVFIESLKQVTQLPDFSTNRRLRRIHLQNLVGLTDLSSLRNAPALKEFRYTQAHNQEPENMLPSLENPVVERVFCNFGSDKKNSRFNELAKQYKKGTYDLSEFEYD
jgi:hypothetical protein